MAAGTCWNLAVAARLFLLARGVEASPGYRDTRTYAMGRAADPATGLASGNPHVLGPFNDAYHRNVYQHTVALQNVTARRFSP